MRFIPTKIHGFLDYTVGSFLVLLPLVLGIATSTAAGYVPIALGFFAIIYSLMTRYEWGLIYLIPMSAHLAIDLMLGVFLALSPWIFGFQQLIYWPYLAMGIFAIAASLLTRKSPVLRVEALRIRPPKSMSQEAMLKKIEQQKRRFTTRS